MSSHPLQRLAALALMAGCALPSAALAQNRVISGAFDQSLAAWASDGTDGRSAAWNSDDGDASPASGSVEIRHAGTATGFPVMVLSQCVPLSGMPVGATPFGVRSKALQESASVVQAHVSLVLYRDFVCSDFLSPGPNYALALNNPNWIDLDTSFNRNADTHSVRIELGISKNAGAGSTGTVRFDAIYVGAQGPGPVPVELARWTIDAGGGRVGGGGIVLSGSIGQPDAGSASGGGIELQGGFWFDVGTAGPQPGDLIFQNGFESP